MIRYFAEDKAAKKLSFQNVLKRIVPHLQTSGVIEGSHTIQSGMDLLAPDKGSTVQTVEEVGESLYSTDGDSQVSPCVARQKRREVKVAKH